MLAAAHMAQAGPTGGQIVAGSGSIAQSGQTTTVTQQSQNASLSWQGFNTGAGETVNFLQPSASAIAVNRIFDSNPTQFLGRLNANGQVYLINPNGILFGAGSQVNVGGLVASTLDMKDASLAGASRRFSGNGIGSIVNQGTINAASGGYVAFIGNKVSNQGSISAPAGTVAMGAGSDVTLSFAGNSLLNMQVNQSTLDNLAQNGGLISADGGSVVMSAGAKDAVLASVVNNTGIIQARSVQNINGAIVLDGGAQGTVTNSGTLDASGKHAGATGGTVKVLGRDVQLASTSKIDVAGDAGGGTALIGGNFLGVGPEQNAQTATVAAGSNIDADAITSGNGGSVAVWANETTKFDGTISARGGAFGGNGGQVETSAHKLTVGQKAMVYTSAPNGVAGNWLLDPQDILIGSVADLGSTYAIDVDTATLNNALNNGNVTIKTTGAPGSPGNGDIVVLDTIGSSVSHFDPDHTAHYTFWNQNNFTLTLSAYRNIRFKYTENYYSPGAGTTYSAGGGIDLSSNGAGGNVVMKADNTGTGVGTVVMDRNDGWNVLAMGSPSSRIKIYYNPTSYNTPSDYTQYILFGDSSQVETYMAVNIASVINSKTYDGTIAASLQSVSSRNSLPSGMTLDTSGAYATFADKNAGINKAVTVGGVTFGGGGTTTSFSGQNYFINGLDGATATINKANLSLSGITANNRTYDGTTAATISGTASVTALGGDVVSVSGLGAGSTFDTKNVGNSKAVTVNGYTLSGADAANYSLVMPTGLTANVAKANLAVSGIGAASKTYDGTTAATLTGTANVTAFGSDAVSVSGTGTATFANKNAGSNKAVTVNGYTLAGADATNYNIVQPTGLTATIDKASLAVAGVTAADKTYDGTTVAMLAGTATVTAIGGDVVSISGSGAGAFADKNAGATKVVSVTGYTLGGADAGNYNLVQPSGVTATINKASLNVAGLAASDKTYDGTTVATLSGIASVTALGSDVVSVTGTGTGTFADKNAGANKAVAVAGYALTGADAANYTLVQPTGLTATINKAALNVSGIAAADRIYDGTANATLTGTATVSAFGSDVVSVSGTGSGVFADKNAGASKAVTATGYSLIGTDAGNYNLVQPTGLTATIGKADLALAGVSAADKTYDGTTAATLAGVASVAPIGSDVVSVSGTGTGNFSDKNAGSNKTVTVIGYTLSGADAANYNLVQPSGLTATISRADLAITGLAASNKTYDGTTAASLSGTAAVAAIGGDVVSVAGTGTATFADKNAGADKAVTVSGYTLTGADAGNYAVVQPAGLTATIGKANLDMSGVTALDRTYDGTTAATLSGTAAVAAFGSDAVSVAGAGNGSFTDKNVGTSKAVTVTGYSLAGADAGNYNLQQPVGVVATINKAAVTVGGITAADKTYDGTTAAALSGAANVAAFGNDTVVVAGTGTASFSDKNAGANKAVTVAGYSLTGADAGNYILVQPTGLSATIDKASVVVGGVTALDKTYDGTTAATLSGIATVNAIGSDAISLAGTGNAAFADKHAGVNKAVSVNGYSLTGADAGNYTLVQPTGLAASISKASITVGGITAGDKVFDGTPAATVSTTGAVLAGRIGSDDVRVNASGAFADASVGKDKVVNIASTYGGADAQNYVYVDQATTTASITPAAALPSPVKPIPVQPAPIPDVPVEIAPAPVTPVLPNLLGQQVRDLVTQVQSVVLPPQAAAQPQSLGLSSTIGISNADAKAQEEKPRDTSDRAASRLINTAAGANGLAPNLQIQNGGMRLPPVAISISE